MKSTWKISKKPIVYDEKKLFNYGINRLSTRDYGRQELFDKMTRFQEDSSMVNKVLDKLQTLGYLSDERRAQGILNQYSAKESVYKVKQRMQRIGLDKDLIENLVEEKKTDEHFSEIDVATGLLQKKFKSLNMNPEIEIKQKMIRFLASKGYGYDLIKKAIDQYFNN